MDLTDITDTEMQTGMKGMKKGRVAGVDEMWRYLLPQRRDTSAGQRDY